MHNHLLGLKAIAILVETLFNGFCTHFNWLTRLGGLQFAGRQVRLILNIYWISSSDYAWFDKLAIEFITPESKSIRTGRHVNVESLTSSREAKEQTAGGEKKTGKNDENTIIQQNLNRLINVKWLISLTLWAIVPAATPTSPTKSPTRTRWNR